MIKIRINEGVWHELFSQNDKDTFPILSCIAKLGSEGTFSLQLEEILEKTISAPTQDAVRKNLLLFLKNGIMKKIGYNQYILTEKVKDSSKNAIVVSQDGNNIYHCVVGQENGNQTSSYAKKKNKEYAGYFK